MRVLITRSDVEAARLASELETRGYEVLQEPLFEIEPTAEVPKDLPALLRDVQALLFTSANGVRAFAELSPERDRRAFTVGDATALAARKAGFTKVESAEGNAQDLATLVVARLKPDHGALFHAAGKAVAGDLKGRLEAAGFTFKRAVLYQALARDRLSETTLAALRAGRVDAVLFFSPRTGKTFVRLLERHGLSSSVGSAQAFCLSEAVASELRPLAWAGLQVSARPNQEALLASLDRFAKDEPEKQSEDEMDQAEGQENPAARPVDQPVDQDGDEAPALAVIAAFGGIRPMAAKLGVAVSTVQGWRERAAIPPARHREILAVAQAKGVPLDPKDLEASAKAPAITAAPLEAVKGAAAPHYMPEPAALSRDDRSRQQSAPAMEAAPRPARTQSWPLGFLLGAAVFAAGAGVAMLSREAWLPFLGEPARVAAPTERDAKIETGLSDLGEEVGSIARSVGALESKLATLAAKPSESGAPSATVDALAQRLDALEPLSQVVGDMEARLAALETEPAVPSASPEAVASLGADIGALTERLAALESGLAELERAPARSAPGELASGAVLGLALGQFRDALARAAPFAPELAVLRGLTEDDAELQDLLDRLSAQAESGVPTLETLRRGFPEVARAVVVAGLGGEDQGLLASVMRRVSSIVTLRPVGQVDGTGPAALVARAESLLAADDLAAALVELDRLTAAPLEAAAPWRAKAEARLAAEQAVSLLSARVLTELAPGDS